MKALGGVKDPTGDEDGDKDVDEDVVLVEDVVGPKSEIEVG